MDCLLRAGAHGYFRFSSFFFFFFFFLSFFSQVSALSELDTEFGQSEALSPTPAQITREQVLAILRNISAPEAVITARREAMDRAAERAMDYQNICSKALRATLKPLFSDMEKCWIELIDLWGAEVMVYIRTDQPTEYAEKFVPSKEALKIPSPMNFGRLGAVAIQARRERDLLLQMQKSCGADDCEAVKSVLADRLSSIRMAESYSYFYSQRGVL